MLFSLFITCIILQIRPAHFQTCKVNNDYRRLVLSSSPVVLCTDAACNAHTEILSENTIYASCKTGSNLFPLKIQVSNIQLHQVKAIKCLTKQGWVTKDENYLCDQFNNLVFKPYPTMGESDFYVVGCDDQETEFPNAGIPRLQIMDYEGYQDKGISPEFLFFPTSKLTCVSNCVETIPIWETTNTATVAILGKHVIVKTSIPNSEYSKVNKITCKAGNSISRMLSFYIPNEINASIITNIEGKSRTPQNMYDAEETLSCEVNGRNTFMKAKGGAPIPNITLVELDSNLNIIKEFAQSQGNLLIIPEGLQLIRGSFGLICHFGPYKSPVPNSYFIIKKWKISIGAKYKTKLLYSDTNVEIKDFNILTGSKIKCNEAYYKQPGPIGLYILYGRLASYPKSILSNYNKTNYDNASGVLHFEKKFHGRQIFAFCLINNQITVPVDIFAGDKPEINIVNVHPRWQSKYHFPGYTFICNATNVEEINLMCMDCLPDTRMKITKVNANQMQLKIPFTIKRNADITYKCTGVSTKYSDVSKLIKLRVIVSSQLNVDKSSDILIYGRNYISCKTLFTIFVRSTAIPESTPSPTQLKIDNGPVINEKCTEKYLLLQKDQKHYLNSNEKVNFEICCSSFVNNTYSCPGAWHRLLVARSYQVKYNLDLSNLYPGNLLKCYLCAEYTFEDPSPPCTGIHMINTKVRMKVKHPDGIIRYTSYADEVAVPREGLKPDKKSFYKISDYEMFVQCKVNNENITKKISIKSCNTNPPPIFISPPDKSMFVAGDIISCTTESLQCRHGLSYVMYIQAEGEAVIRKEVQSHTLEKKQTGNNIKIKCTAGEGERSKSDRVIRVEMKPFNVSIGILKPMMVYKKYLRCNAQGFPPPSITWSQTKGPSSLMISEHFLLIGPWDFSGNYTIHCEAKNERGTVTVTESFQIFNPRITTTDFSLHFSIFIPLLTLCYLLLLTLSLLLIFQENVFGVPFFCGGVAVKQKPNKTETKEETTESVDKVS